MILQSGYKVFSRDEQNDSRPINPSLATSFLQQCLHLYTVETKLHIGKLAKMSINMQ